MKETRVEKELLKKLGNYFGKGIKISALTALLATAGCTTSTSGSEIDPGYQEPESPTQPVDPSTPEPTDPTKPTPEPTDPEITPFDLHSFTEGVDAFTSANSEAAAAYQYKYTKDAQTYIVDKFKALQNQLQAENPTENTFKMVLNDAINLKDKDAPYDSPYMLAHQLERGIPGFYQETAKYVAQIVNNLAGDDQAKFRTCYDRLAAQSYENSLTVKKNSHSYPDLVTVNEDKEAIAAELQMLGIKDDNDAEQTLMALLTQVANNNNIKASTLKDAVNLAFNIDGLYGLRDSVMIQGGGVPAQTDSSYTGWVEYNGFENALPPRARYIYDPMEKNWPMNPKPMFNDMLDAELEKLQIQTYEMGR